MQNRPSTEPSTTLTPSAEDPGLCPKVEKAEKTEILLRSVLATLLVPRACSYFERAAAGKQAALGPVVGDVTPSPKHFVRFSRLSAAVKIGGLVNHEDIKPMAGKGTPCVIGLGESVLSHYTSTMKWLSVLNTDAYRAIQRQSFYQQVRMTFQIGFPLRSSKAVANAAFFIGAMDGLRYYYPRGLEQPPIQTLCIAIAGITSGWVLNAMDVPMCRLYREAQVEATTVTTPSLRGTVKMLYQQHGTRAFGVGGGYNVMVSAVAFVTMQAAIVMASYGDQGLKQTLFAKPNVLEPTRADHGVRAERLPEPSAHATCRVKP